MEATDDSHAGLDPGIAVWPIRHLWNEIPGRDYRVIVMGCCNPVRYDVSSSWFEECKDVEYIRRY